MFPPMPQPPIPPYLGDMSPSEQAAAVEAYAKQLDAYEQDRKEKLKHISFMTWTMIIVHVVGYAAVFTILVRMTLPTVGVTADG